MFFSMAALRLCDFELFYLFVVIFHYFTQKYKGMGVYSLQRIQY